MNLNTLTYLLENYQDFEIETIFSMEPIVTDEESEEAEKALAPEKLPGAGLLFRYQDEKNYYFFGTFGSKGYKMGKVVDGQLTVLKMVLGSERKPGECVTLGVKCSGNDILCFKGLDEILRESDGQFPLGRVGLMTFNTISRFEYFKLWEWQRVQR